MIPTTRVGWAWQRYIQLATVDHRFDWSGHSVPAGDLLEFACLLDFHYPLAQGHTMSQKNLPRICKRITQEGLK